MAKNATKTNALGMELRPSSFKTVEKEAVAPKEPVTPVEMTPAEKATPAKKPTPAETPKDILANLEIDKDVIKGFSFTLREENVKKLRALAKKHGVSASKMLDHILAEVIR